jgi:hypothetical protein
MEKAAHRLGLRPQSRPDPIDCFEQQARASLHGVAAVSTSPAVDHAVLELVEYVAVARQDLHAIETSNDGVLGRRASPIVQGKDVETVHSF